MAKLGLKQIKKLDQGKNITHSKKGMTPNVVYAAKPKN